MTWATPFLRAVPAGLSNQEFAMLAGRFVRACVDRGKPFDHTIEGWRIMVDMVGFHREMREDDLGL